jgi:hypothetical protein
MSSADLIRAAIIFDVEALRADPHGRAFVSVLSLEPQALSGREEELAEGALSVASAGLAAELQGDRVRALSLYRSLSRRRGASGLLGALFIAWLPEASDADFDAVVRKLPAADLDLQAWVHCKLMTWAIDHGWRERAARHFDLAIEIAQGDLAEALRRSAGWFDRRVAVTWGHSFTDPLVLCESATSRERTAADEHVKRAFEESIRHPWTRVIRFGGDVAGLRSVEAADLHASWAGALWLLPNVRQQYARIALPQQSEPEEVSRAIGSWIRGGGKDIARVVDAFEDRLTSETIQDLLIGQLHEGRNAKQRPDWVALCHALWDQLPNDLCLTLVDSFEPFDLSTPHDERAEEYALFASLVMRTHQEWASRAATFDDAHLATVFRFLHPTLVKFVPSQILERSLNAFLQTLPSISDDWADSGFDTMAMVWQRLPQPKSELGRWLAELLPQSLAPSVAINVPGLVSRDKLRQARDSAIEQLDTDLDNAKKGTFGLWGMAPAPLLARAVIALGSSTKRATATLVRTATATECSSEQRYYALRALIALAEAGIPAAAPRDTTALITTSATPGRYSLDTSADGRLEDVCRLALRVRLSSRPDRSAEILAATRDPDARVREVALQSATWMFGTRRKRSAAIETAVFGALYDPQPRIQAIAAEAVTRYGLEPEALQRVAMQRIEATFMTSQRDVRAAIARGLTTSGRYDGMYGRLRKLTRQDRSFVVRYTESQNGD